MTTNGTWLSTGTSDEWDCEISGITGIGSSSTTLLAGTGIWHCGLIRDVSFKNFKTVLGTQAQKLLMTASLIDGWWQMQGFYNGAVHLGGSDNRLFMGSSLSDASQAYNTAGNAAGQFQYWFDGLDNTQIGPLYITASGLWGGIKVTGVAYNQGISGNRGMLWMYGATVEGQSKTVPNNGALIRVEGRAGGSSATATSPARWTTRAPKVTPRRMPATCTSRAARSSSTAPRGTGSPGRPRRSRCSTTTADMSASVTHSSPLTAAHGPVSRDPRRSAEPPSSTTR